MLQSTPTNILLGGHQPILLEYDLITGKEISQVANHKYIVMDECSLISYLINSLTLERKGVPFYGDTQDSFAQV